ncbi:ubiquitin thioesterase OTU1-like protein [Euroglyphus maynei]|uniref:Ubiquitin thioesterase OTU n=1 Tax=Euroglyphus maynei TaxID=6958 RepID=A0A1Y3B4Q8_EURMA|nr:ubiquitin thioesterase OTU1-like protein [Euroglyphus maynei]
MSDWDKVTVLNKRPARASDLRTKQAVNNAMKSGVPIETTKKFNAATNKHAGPSVSAVKLDQETEDFHHSHVSMDVSKLISVQRQKIGMTQKELATKICEKPQVVNEYEAGKAIPNQQILAKMERALGVKLRGKDKGLPLVPKSEEDRKEIWQRIMIRFNCNGQFTIDTLLASSTVGELKSIIWSVTEIHPDNCKLMIGYPPKEIFLVDDEQLIKEIIPNRRETLIMDEQSSSSNNCENFKPSAAAKNVQPFNSSDETRLIRRMERIEVPANNSCLFVSVHFCLTGEIQEKCPRLRNLIAETVRSDPITYNEGFLGKSNNDYQNWIRNEDHWGGGIELSILSSYYEIEIVAVDTQNERFNRFGEDKNYARRIFLIFDGIHYDPLVVHSNDMDNPIQTNFSSNDFEVIEMALDVARKAKAKHQYTDLNQMYLKCNQCNRLFDQNQARKHASSTGHINFSELNDKK